MNFRAERILKLDNFLVLRLLQVFWQPFWPSDLCTEYLIYILSLE